MRIESSITSLTWIPSEAIKGMPKLPFEWGVAHYDEPPDDRLVDLDVLEENDLFREANELKAWIEVDDDGNDHRDAATRAAGASASRASSSAAARSPSRRSSTR